MIVFVVWDSVKLYDHLKNSSDTNELIMKIDEFIEELEDQLRSYEYFYIASGN